MLLLGLATALPLGAQRRKELENDRRQLIKQINTTSKLLKTTRQNKAATLDHFVALQEQIKTRSQLLLNLQEEIADLDERMTSTGFVVESLKSDIARLKQDYAVLVRHAYRMKATSNSLLFLLSAHSFNDALRRWQYLRRYEQYRLKQARLITATQKDLEDKIKLQAERKHKHQELLDKEQKQTSILESELKEKERLLEKLKKEESKLKNQLAEQQQQHEQLNLAIENVIKNEMATKRQNNRQPSALAALDGSSKPNMDKLPSDAVGGSFPKNKGKLPWPVDSGFITRRFGKQEHPTLKGIQIENNGIDIQTENSAVVSAVFEGIVSGVQFIPGHDYMLILRHGNYYTVYSKLKEVDVKRGDVVLAKQAVGKVSTDSFGKSEMHFEVWHEKKRLNPSAWVARK